MINKKGFSLIELIIVIVIIGIMLYILVGIGLKQKDIAIYNAFIRFTDQLAAEACPAYLDANNIDYFTSTPIIINYNNLINSLGLPDKYNGKTPNGNQINITYTNFKCIIKYSIPKEYISFWGIKSIPIIEGYSGDQANIAIVNNINIDNISKTMMSQNYLFNRRSNIFGTFAIQTNLNSINAYGRNLNRMSDLNMNQKDYNDLSYAPNAIPDGQPYAR